jgi:hypothetical protein
VAGRSDQPAPAVGRAADGPPAPGGGSADHAHLRQEFGAGRRLRVQPPPASPRHDLPGLRRARRGLRPATAVCRPARNRDLAVHRVLGCGAVDLRGLQARARAVELAGGRGHRGARRYRLGDPARLRGLPLRGAAGVCDRALRAGLELHRRRRGRAALPDPGRGPAADPPARRRRRDRRSPGEFGRPARPIASRTAWLVLGLGVPVLLWSAYALPTFGSILPNTAAKIAQGSSGSGRPSSASSSEFGSPTG